MPDGSNTATIPVEWAAVRVAEVSKGGWLHTAIASPLPSYGLSSPQVVPGVGPGFNLVTIFGPWHTGGQGRSYPFRDGDYLDARYILEKLGPIPESSWDAVIEAVKLVNHDPSVEDPPSLEHHRG